MALPTGPVPDRVLLVEGRDDLHVVHHICRRSQPMPDFEIVEKSGIDRLLDSISVELEAPGRRAVGILVDANDDIEARWSAVKDRVSSAGIALGDRDPNGKLVRRGALEPDVGVWIMPDNRSPGELEDFIADMVSEDDSVWPLSRPALWGWRLGRGIWRWGGTSAPNWPLGFGSCLDRLPTGKFFPRSRHQPA